MLWLIGFIIALQALIGYACCAVYGAQNDAEQHWLEMDDDGCREDPYLHKKEKG